MAYGSEHGAGGAWRRSLQSALASIKASGTFAWSSGDVADEEEDGESWELPEISVEGVDLLSLPLDTTQAAALLAAGTPAPFGRGPHTVLDPAVRCATQLDASLVSIAPTWRDQLSDITEDAAEALGIVDAGALGIQARLYKLLLYEPGGHFTVHRDTEKEPGMFGTLLVQLPVAGGHEGGALHICHQGKQFVWETAPPSKSAGVQVAAFFADCEHELKPITAGLRLVLAYNLVRTAPGALPRAPAPTESAHMDALAAAVREWDAAAGVAPSHGLVAIPLEHKYTETNVSFAGLKGRDAALVQLLRDCDLLDVNLALMTKHVTGDADYERSYHKRGRYNDWGRRRRGDDEGDEDEESSEEPEDDGANATMLNMNHEQVSMTTWTSPSGGNVDFSRLGACLHKRLLDGGELFDGGEPDDREYEGHMGNYGPTLQFFYHRAVAVVWPRSRSATIICAAGRGAALDLLHQRLQAMVPHEGRQQSAEAAQQAQHDAVQLLDAVVAMLERDTAGPVATSWRSSGGRSSGAYDVQALRVLTSGPALALLGDRRAEPSMRLVARMMRSTGLATAAVVQGLAAAASALSDPAFEDAVVLLVTTLAVKQLALCAQLATAPAAPASLRSRAGPSLMGVALGPSFAKLQPSDVVLLARMVSGAEPCFRARAATFAAAVLARRDQALLVQLLKEPIVARAAAAGKPHAVALLAERVRTLEAVVARGAPVFTWAFPQAQLAGYPQVEAFLRGPERRKTFSGMFPGLTQAQSWAHKHFRYGGIISGYSAAATVAGRGKAASCTIEKSEGLYQQEDTRYRQQLAELAAARAMLPPTSGKGQAAAVHRAAAPAGPAGGTAHAQARPAARTPLMDLTGQARSLGKAATKSVLVGLTADLTARS